MEKKSYLVEEKSITDLQSDMSAGKITSEKLVDAYLTRIKTIDESGPSLIA